MALLKITALANITIIDPFPLEGVGETTIQLLSGQYKEYSVLDEQANRLIPLLNRARAQSKLTYIVEYANQGVALTVEDEGILVSSNCRILNLVGGDVTAIAEGLDKVTIYHPMPPLSPFLGSGLGAFQFPIPTIGYVSTPEGGEGSPYRANGWDNRSNNRRIVNSTQVAAFKTGQGITHTSVRVTSLQLGTITASLFSALGIAETVMLTLNPLGGDQVAFSVHSWLVIRVSDTRIIGSTVEGRVTLYADIPAKLSEVSNGQGGYFNLTCAHSAANSQADFGSAFWDAGEIPQGSEIPLVEVVVPSLIHISGIRYYDVGSSFRVRDSNVSGVTNIVNSSIDAGGNILNVDAADFGAAIGAVPFFASVITGLTYSLTQSPRRTDRAMYEQVLSVGPVDVMSSDARVRTTWANPIGDRAGSPKTSVAGKYQICTPDGSTTSYETFERETFRLQNENVSVFTTDATNYQRWVGVGAGTDLRNWNAQQSIDIGSVGCRDALQFYMGRLIYPYINFMLGYSFVDFDYSVAVGSRDFIRAFYVGDLNNHKKFTVTCEVQGITASDVAIGAGSDDSKPVRFDLLFPGPRKAPLNGANSTLFPGSEWLHGGKPFNAATFTGAAGDGILESATLSGNLLTLTLITGTMSSVYTQGIVICRVRFKDTVTGSLGQMSVVGV